MQPNLNDLATFRMNLANAKAALRTAKDAYEVTRAVAELAAIERLNGNAGKNEAERARNLTVELLHDDTHTQALAHLRECERQVDELNACIAVEEDAIRAAELAARERLAEALLGRRADNAIADTTLRDALHDAAERLFAIAEDMGCDAGNFDGGSSANCEHCRIVGHANHIERLLAPPTDNVDWYEVARRAERTKFDALERIHEQRVASGELPF